MKDWLLAFLAAVAVVSLIIWTAKILFWAFL
jgi:hypothetical protein